MGSCLRKHKNSNSKTFSIVWLDPTVNNYKENINAQHELRKLVNHLKTFTDANKCEQYIQSVPVNNQIILIVNGHLGQVIVPRIHQLHHISSIYVFCIDKGKHEQWSKQYAKIKAVIVQLNELILQIQSNQNKQIYSEKHESFAFNIFNPNATIIDEQSTTGINGQFIHSQLLIHCLIRMKSTTNEKNEFVSFCKDKYKRDAELKTIRDFERDYTPDSALYWYTRQSLIYQDLNKALRTQNINLLFLFRFFIRDLAQQLEKYQCTSPIQTYRGQFMPNEELKLLRDAVGQFISINSFFSTTFDLDVALIYLGAPPAPNGLQRVLFEINADPHLDGTKPFASIGSVSNFKDEQEVLMMIGSVFRLTNVYCEDNQTWIVQMRLCSDNDHALKSISDHMQNEFLGVGETSLGQFGNILRSMGRLDDAEKYYQRLLKDLPHGHQDIAGCHYGLGIVAAKKTQYDESLKQYKTALQIYQATLESSHREIANIHNCIGSIYKSKGESANALKSYNEALKLYQQVLGKDHDDVAMCFGNIGNIYEKDKKYFEALQYHRKALDIWQKSLPADHRYLGSTYNNIANVYYSLGQYDQALKHYSQSLEIKEKSFPHQHPSIANTLENIGNVCEKTGQFQRALTYLNQAAEIYNRTWPPTHSDVINIKKTIRRVSSHIIDEILVN